MYSILDFGVEKFSRFCLSTKRNFFIFSFFARHILLCLLWFASFYMMYIWCILDFLFSVLLLAGQQEDHMACKYIWTSFFFLNESVTVPRVNRLTWVLLKNVGWNGEEIVYHCVCFCFDLASTNWKSCALHQIIHTSIHFWQSHLHNIVIRGSFHKQLTKWHHSVFLKYEKSERYFL